MTLLTFFLRWHAPVVFFKEKIISYDFEMIFENKAPFLFYSYFYLYQIIV